MPPKGEKNGWIWTYYLILLLKKMKKRIFSINLCQVGIKLILSNHYTINFIFKQKIYIYFKSFFSISLSKIELLKMVHILLHCLWKSKSFIKEYPSNLKNKLLSFKFYTIIFFFNIYIYILCNGDIGVFILYLLIEYCYYMSIII